MIAQRLARGLTELREVTFQSPLGDLQDMFGGSTSLAGVTVNGNTALAVPAFYTGIKILAESMGTMPCEVMRRTADNVAVPAPESRLWTLLHDKPNPELEAGDFWEIVTSHIGIRGNAYMFKQRDEYDRVSALWPIPPQRVQVQRDPRTRQKIFMVSPSAEDPFEMPFTQTDMLHMRGFGPDPLRGLSPIGAMRELIGRASAEQDYQSALMANQARPSGVLVTDKKLDPVRGQRLARRFKRSMSGARRAGETLILEEGLKWQQVSLSAADAQFIEQREFTTKDIARMLRIPADMMLVASGDKLHYTSDESVGLRFLTFTLMPWMRRTEGPLRVDEDLPWTMSGPTPGRLFPKFQPDVLLRVDRKTRFEAYQVAIDSGWMTPDEARVMENRVPLGLSVTKPLTAAPATQTRNKDLPENTTDPDDLERLLEGALS